LGYNSFQDCLLQPLGHPTFIKDYILFIFIVKCCALNDAIVQLLCD